MFKPKELKKLPPLIDETPLPQENISSNEYSSSPANRNVEKNFVANNTPATEIKSIVASVNEPQIFNGNNINDLEKVGFQTIDLLKVAPKSIIDKPKFNIPFLQATPLNLIFKSFNAEEIAYNKYLFMGFEFSITENKWYNITERKGNINAISLTKQLMAIEEDLNLQENEKMLWIASCKKINELQQQVQNLQAISEQEEAKPEVINSDKPVGKTNNSPTPLKEHTPYKEIDWKQLTEQLNSIPLESVMEHIGADPNEDGHSGQWKIHRTAHNIQVTNNQWNNWNLREGGVGAISLLAQYISLIHNINTKDEENRKRVRKMAIKELMNVFGSDFDSSLVNGVAQLNFKVPFSMPHIIDFKINEVRKYLNVKRGLPLWIINKQIETGNLFAGFPSTWKPHVHLKNPAKLENENVWATFLAINGNAAEMRGIDRYDGYAKIRAAGNEGDAGSGFTIRAEKDCSEKTVVALEAAIDSMSYHAFYPGRVATSCMGVNFKLAVQSAIQALESNYKFEFGFDNDLAGNEAAVSFKSELIEEIGEEEYQKYIDKKQIKLFSLGIKVLQETIKNNETFYFDVKNNETGRASVLMFQEQLFNEVSRDTVKKWLAKGQLKYINVCPVFTMMQDPKLEARQVIDLLESGKPYYLRSIQEEDEKPEIQLKRAAFENAVKELSKNKMDKWEQDGRLIFEKKAIAKDWNELFLYMKNDPVFQETLRTQEETYIEYTKKPEIAVSKKETKKSMNN